MIINKQWQSCQTVALMTMSIRKKRDNFKYWLLDVGLFKKPREIRNLNLTMWKWQTFVSPLQVRILIRNPYLHSHRGFLEHWNSQKSVCNIWQCFSCLLDWFQKYGRNWILTVAFWGQTKAGQKCAARWAELAVLFCR